MGGEKIKVTGLHSLCCCQEMQITPPWTRVGHCAQWAGYSTDFTEGVGAFICFGVAIKDQSSEVVWSMHWNSASPHCSDHIHNMTSTAKFWAALPNCEPFHEKRSTPFCSATNSLWKDFPPLGVLIRLLNLAYSLISHYLKILSSWINQIYWGRERIALMTPIWIEIFTCIFW